MAKGSVLTEKLTSWQIGVTLCLCWNYLLLLLYYQSYNLASSFSKNCSGRKTAQAVSAWAVIFYFCGFIF